MSLEFPIPANISPLEKKGGAAGPVLVVVVGTSNRSGNGRALVARALASGQVGAVILTGRGVRAGQFATGQEILCTPIPGADHFEYAGVAPLIHPARRASTPFQPRFAPARANPAA